MWDNRPRLRPYSRKRATRDADEVLDALSNQDVIDLFRLDEEGINFFVNKLYGSHHLERKTKFGLSMKYQLLVTLRYVLCNRLLHNKFERCL